MEISNSNNANTEIGTNINVLNSIEQKPSTNSENEEKEIFKVFQNNNKSFYLKQL